MPLVAWLTENTVLLCLYGTSNTLLSLFEHLNQMFLQKPVWISLYLFIYLLFLYFCRNYTKPVSSLLVKRILQQYAKQICIFLFKITSAAALRRRHNLEEIILDEECATYTSRLLSCPLQPRCGNPVATTLLFQDSTVSNPASCFPSFSFKFCTTY